MLIKKDKFCALCDEELMLFVMNGDTGAFDELYKRYGKRLMNYFLKMLNYHNELAEDALQDLFMKIAESPEKYDASRPFKTWVFSIASNYCKNIYRHNLVKERYYNELAFTSVISHETTNYIESKLDSGSFEYCLNEVLKELTPERKEAFILRYQEGKSIAEIALIQDCPEGSVKSRLHYTLKYLEEQLNQFNPKK